MIEFWYVSTPAFTVLLETEDGRVVGGPPITRWAKGKSRIWLIDYWDSRWPGQVHWKQVERDYVDE